MRSQRRHTRSFVRPTFYLDNAEPTHFMKVVLPRAIHTENMLNLSRVVTLQRIPNEFVRRFENELCACEATVGVPDGRVWKIELKKSENEVWFCKGWEEFVKYYSLRFGFFLMFKYEGKSQFSVVIIDSSAAEIYYPRKVDPEKHNSAPECRRKRPASFHRSGYKTRSQRKKLVEDEEEIIDIDDEDEDALSHGKPGNRDTSGQGHCSKMKKRTLSKKQRAIEAAQNFQEAADKSFTAIVRFNNINRWFMDVPASFWKAYMGRVRPMKLQDCKGREWEANYYKQGSSIRIGKGWMDFARANDVKEGDACVFKLIKRNSIFVFQLTMFPC